MNVLGCLPPIGIGIYARNQPVSFLRTFDFVALNADRSDTESKGLALSRAGVTVWVYSLPGAWRPGRWRAALARCESMATRIGAAGIIADPENGWPGAENATEAHALGQALGEAASKRRVVVTSYPLFPHLDELARGCDGRVAGSPQLYAKGRPAAQLVQWAEAWRARFGAYIPSVSAWASDPSIGDADGYAEYLRAIVPAPGAIAWTTGTGPDWMFQTYRRSAPVSTMALVQAAMRTPAFIGGAAVLLLGIIGAIAWTK